MEASTLVLRTDVSFYRRLSGDNDLKLLSVFLRPSES